MTGGAGFIGSHLVEALLGEGLRVRVVDDLATGHLSNLAHVDGAVRVDRGERRRFRRLPAGGRRALIMCFTRRPFPACRARCGNHWRRTQSGPTATINMLEAARPRACDGSCSRRRAAPYGDTTELPKHEDILPHPLSPYAAGKLAGEHYVQVYAQTMGLDGVSLRYFNIFGPRQDPSSPYSGVISIFIDKMSRGQRPTIYGDGSQTRDFTYVANAVAANLAAMRHPGPLGGDVFNVGSGQSIRLLDLVASLNTIFGTDLEPEFQPAASRRRPRFAGKPGSNQARSLATSRSFHSTRGWRERSRRVGRSILTLIDGMCNPRFRAAAANIFGGESGRGATIDRPEVAWADLEDLQVLYPRLPGRYDDLAL